MITLRVDGKTGRTVIVFGITTEDLEKIKDGDEFTIEGEIVGIQGIEFCHVFGDTDEDIMDQLAADLSKQGAENVEFVKLMKAEPT